MAMSFMGQNPPSVKPDRGPVPGRSTPPTRGPPELGRPSVRHVLWAEDRLALTLLLAAGQGSQRALQSLDSSGIGGCCE